MEVKQRYGSSTLLIEDSPISRGLIQSLREQSISVTCYKPDTDKRARVIAQTDLFAAGSVRLPQRAAWLEDFTAELLAFPGRHDDQVDALTQGPGVGSPKTGRGVLGNRPWHVLRAAVGWDFRKGQGLPFPPGGPTFCESFAKKSNPTEASSSTEQP
jgi:Terminase RNaseH-like domain